MISASCSASARSARAHRAVVDGIRFQRLKRTPRETHPEGSKTSVVLTDVERAAGWSLMSNGREIVLARWSSSNHAYIDTNLLPIPGSHDTMTHAMPLGIKSIIDIPNFISTHEALGDS